MTAIAEWTIDVMRHAPISEDEDQVRQIGSVEVAVFNFNVGIHWAEAGDALGSDVYYTCSSVLLDPRTGRIDEELFDQLPLYPDQLVLLDHMTLDPGERGRGLGPKIATAIMQRLTTSSSLVAAYPQPDGWQDMADKEVAAVRAKIEKTWASIGFHRYRDGVWLKSMALRSGWSEDLGDEDDE